MAMNVGRRSSSVIADINVTPMADVMIVLLIIFMVTVPLIGAPVALPEASQAREKKGERIEVIVGSGGAITAGEERFAGPEAFGDYLALRFEGRPGATILIQADRSSSYSEVAGVLEACRRAGAAEIALAARTPLSGS